MVDSCIRHKIARLVHVSSLSVLDHASHDPRSPVTEDSPDEPQAELRGLYTRSKLESELFVRNAAANLGLRAVIIRPGQIFGAGTERIPPPGVIALGNHWIVVGDGEQVLPLVYVEDVADALLRAAESSKVPAIYNIVDPDAITQREYLTAIRAQLSRDVTVHYCPKLLLLAAGWMCEVGQALMKRELPLSRYRVRSIRPLNPFDLTAATKELLWQPRIGVRAALSARDAGQQPHFSEVLPSDVMLEQVSAAQVDTSTK